MYNVVSKIQLFYIFFLKNLHISKIFITFAPKLKYKTGRQPETAAKKL